MKLATILTPSIGLALLGACSTTTTATPVVACGPDNVATTNWDVVFVNNYEAGWYYAASDPLPAGFFTDALTLPTTDAIDAGLLDAGLVAASNAAASAAAAAVGNYFPNGCATASASSNVVTYMFNNCSGPLDLIGINGTVTATFGVGHGMIGIQLSGTNIAANGATINLSTSGVLTTSNGRRMLTATSQTSGTGPDGNSAAHAGTYTIVWTPGSGCATLNGTFTGVGTGSFSGTTTKISNYVACTNKCPQSGTTESTFSGGSVMLTFNGSNTAQCAASDGTSASVALQCQ